MENLFSCNYFEEVDWYYLNVDDEGMKHYLRFEKFRDDQYFNVKILKEVILFYQKN